MKKTKSNIGYKVEEAVAKLLEKQGHEVLQRNFLTNYGEIDIIYREKNSKILVFVEVKYRKSDKYGAPYEAVTKNKVKKIMRAVHIYLTENNISYSTQMRLDVISVLANGKIQHFKAIDTQVFGY